MAKNRKLGRRTDQRMAMLRAMTTYLLESGQIKTTAMRAKEVAPMAEKMITLAKKNDLASYRQALSFITKEDVAKRTATAATPGSSRSVPAGATPRRWPSSSWCKAEIPSLSEYKKYPAL